MASMKSMTTPSAAFAASSPVVWAAIPAKATPPPSATTPIGVRILPSGSRSTAASASAWPGLTREGRRAAR